MIRYKTAILPLLKERGYNTTVLRREKLLSEETIQSLRHDELVSWLNIDRLCRLLDCQPGAILEYVPNDKKT